MATVPIPTTKLCLSTACVSHRRGFGERKVGVWVVVSKG